jgi:hypothetical protein
MSRTDKNPERLLTELPNERPQRSDASKHSCIIKAETRRNMPDRPNQALAIAGAFLDRPMATR